MQQTNSTPRFKLILVGDGGVGVGSGWEKHSEVVESNAMAKIQTGVFPRASWLVTIAARAIGSDVNFSSSAIPQYIRNNIAD